MAGSTISFNASGLKFDIKTFNDYSGYKGLDNYGFDNVYEEIDYSQNPDNSAQAKENAMEQIATETKTENKPQSTSAKNANVETTASEGDEILNKNSYYKGTYNGLSKVASTFINIYKGAGNGKTGWIGYGGEAAVVFVGMMIGGEGIWKSLIKVAHVEGKQVLKKVTSDKLIGQTANINSLTDFKSKWVVPDNWGLRQKVGSILSNGKFMGVVVKQFGGMFAINTAFNVVWDIFDGGEFKWGTDIYKGAVMCVFGTLGKFVGAYCGPWGKAVEAGFNFVGAFVAEVTVKWYDTELGRGIAGVAIVVGAAIGFVIGIAAGVCVGWVVAIVIGVAAVCAFIVWGIEKLFINYFEAVSNAVTNFFNAVGAKIAEGWNCAVDFVKNAGKALWEFGGDVVEFLGDAKEAVVEAGKAVVETVTEAAEVVVDEVVDFVEDVGATVAKGWNTVCSWFC